MRKKLLLKRTCRAALLALALVLTWGFSARALTLYVNAQYDPYVYAYWDDTKYYGNWPGQKITTKVVKNGVEYYKAEVNSSNVNFIVHNNLGQETAIITTYADKYIDYDSSTGYTEALPACAIVRNDYYVYFANANSSWTGTTMYAHVYDDNGHTLTWQSDDEKMVEAGMNGYGNKTYVWTMPLSWTPTKIIFSDGSNQTSETTFTNGGYYNNYSGVSLLSTVPTTKSDVLLVADNFSDANLRSALSEITNTAEGGKMTTQNLKVLHLEDKGISDLNSLYFFPDLEELYAQDNNLTSNSSNGNTTSLNVAANTKLKVLNVSNNSNNGSGKLVQVPGIAYCTALEEYYFNDNDFWGSRQISGENSVAANRISAAKHTNLKRLELRNSGIESSFALPQFSALEYFDMSDNPSFSGFSNTTGSVKLRLPNLKTLKLSNVNLPVSDSLIVKNLVASGNTALEYLDLSHNTKLVRVNLYNSHSLKYLNVDSCMLTCLNLYKNTLLEKAIVRNNSFTKTVNNPSSQNFPGTYNTSYTYLYIRGLNNLKYLDASKCAFTTFGGDASGNQLSALMALDTLILSGNTSSSFKFANVENLSALKYFDLADCTGIIMNSNNQLGYLKPANNPNLETLIVSNINMMNPDMFTGFTNLKYLDVSRNTGLVKLEVSTCPALEEINFTGSGASTLTTLTFSNNGYTSAADMPTFTGLSATGATLNLSNNLLTAAPTLANVTVKKLILDNNRLTNISDLSAMTSLIELSARNNNLVNASLNNTNITTIDLGANTSLRTADLSNNKLTTIAFDGCTALEELDLSYNNLSTFGKAGSIPVNRMNGLNSLKRLNLSHNLIYSLVTNESSYSSIDEITNLEEIDVSYQTNTNGHLHLFNVEGLNSLHKVILSGNFDDAVTSGNSNREYTIHLYNCGMTSLNFTDAADGVGSLESFTRLQEIVIDNNPIVDAVVPRAADNLFKIDLTNNANLLTVNAEHDVNGANSKLQKINVTGSNAITSYVMTGCDAYPVYITQNYITSTNTPNLVTLDLSDNGYTTATGAVTLSGFQYLASANFSDNPGWNKSLSIDNCPALTTIDVENNTAMASVVANNGGYSNCSYPLVKTTADMNLSLYFNQNNFSAIPAVTSGVKYLYLQENAFAQDLTLDGDAIALKGIALSNKSGVSPIKTFTASVASTTPDEWSIDYTQTPPVMVCTAAGDASNTTLEAINLSGNSSLEEIKVNGFKALTKLASGTDMTTAAGKGLYVKSLGGLKKLDVSGNRIEILGQDGSLNGLSGLEELDASHNVIRTLTNKTAHGTGASLRAAYGDGKYTAATCPNIEDLTGLKKLNLSYNNLCDSVHLWKNTNLEWLDVSHNRVITERNAGQTLYYRDSQDGIFKPWKESTWKVVVDAYNGDTNDTIGLRMLDLFYQQSHLKYLDVSETNIMNTAMNHTYMNNRQGPESLNTSTTADSGGHPVGRHGVPHFVLVNHCEALETLLCNNNGMKSLGIGSVVNTSTHVTGCPNLKYLEAQGMRGQDPAIMQCELRISANNPLMEHYDVSGSDFDYIGLAEGATGEHLRYINVSDNYKSQNVYTDNGDGTWSTVIDGKRFTVHGNPYELNISNLPVLDSLIACNAPHLQVVKAHNMPNFEVIDLTQDMASNDLRELYVDHNAKLDNVVGLETLNHLEVYHTNDSHFTGEFVMPVAAKSTLKDLRVSNEALSYAATRNNLTEVDIDGYHLERFDVQNNPAITSIKNSTSATTMKHLDFANCHIDNSGIDEITGMTALEYFNASNDAAADGVDGNWLMDLDLHSSPNIQEIHANNNELYAIKVPATATNLTVVEYANNHVNGADFSGVPSSATINSVNNGRQIKANKSTFVKNGTTYDLYFFQLDESQAGEGYGGSPLKTQQTRPTLHSTADLRQLDTDGFDLQKVSWQAGTTVQGGKQKANAIAGADDVDASKIYGTIVVLDPSQTSSRDASLSSMSYDYQNGNGSMSNYYLDYSASDVVTAIDEINTDGKVPAVRANGMGSIIVSGEPGAVLGLYDMSGRLVQKVVIGDDGSTTVDGLSPGVYVIGGEKVRL